MLGVGSVSKKIELNFSMSSLNEICNPLACKLLAKRFFTKIFDGGIVRQQREHIFLIYFL